MSGVQREVREREKIRRKSQREKGTDAIFQCNFTMVCLVSDTQEYGSAWKVARII